MYVAATVLSLVTIFFVTVDSQTPRVPCSSFPVFDGDNFDGNVYQIAHTDICSLNIPDDVTLCFQANRNYVIRGFLNLSSAAKLYLQDNVRLTIENGVVPSESPCKLFPFQLSNAKHLDPNHPDFSNLSSPVQLLQGRIETGQNVNIEFLDYGVYFSGAPGHIGHGHVAIFAPYIIYATPRESSGSVEYIAEKGVYILSSHTIKWGYYYKENVPSELPVDLEVLPECRKTRKCAASYITSYPGAFDDYMAGRDLCWDRWTDIDGPPSKYHVTKESLPLGDRLLFPPKFAIRAPYVEIAADVLLQSFGEPDEEQWAMPGGTLIVDADKLLLSDDVYLSVPGGIGGIDSIAYTGDPIDPTKIPSSGSGGAIYLKTLDIASAGRLLDRYVLHGGNINLPNRRLRLASQELDFPKMPWDAISLPYGPLWQGPIVPTDDVLDPFQGGPGMLFYTLVDAGGFEYNHLRYHCATHYASPPFGARVISRVPYSLASDFIDVLTISEMSNILFDPINPDGRAMEYRVGSIDVKELSPTQRSFRPTLIVEHPATLDLRCQRKPSGLTCPETLEISDYSVVLKGGIVRTPRHVVFRGTSYAVFAAQVQQGNSIAFPDVEVAEFSDTTLQWSEHLFDPKVLQLLAFVDCQVEIVESQTIAAKHIKISSTNFSIDVSLHMKGDYIDIGSDTVFSSSYLSTRAHEHPLSTLLFPMQKSFGGVHTGCNSVGQCDDILADIIGASNFRNPTLSGSSSGSYSDASFDPFGRARIPVGGAHLRFDVTGDFYLRGSYFLGGEDVNSGCSEDCKGPSAGGSLVVRASVLKAFNPTVIEVKGGSVTSPLVSYYSGASGGRVVVECESAKDDLDLANIVAHGGTGWESTIGYGFGAPGSVYVNCRNYDNVLIVRQRNFIGAASHVPLELALVPGQYPKEIQVNYNAHVRAYVYDFDDQFTLGSSGWAPTSLIVYAQHTASIEFRVVKPSTCTAFDLAQFILETPHNSAPAWREKMIYEYVETCLAAVPTPSETASTTSTSTSTSSITEAPTPTTSSTLSSTGSSTSTSTQSETQAPTGTASPIPSSPSSPSATASSGSSLSNSSSLSQTLTLTHTRTITPTYAPSVSSTQETVVSTSASDSPIPVASFSTTPSNGSGGSGDPSDPEDGDGGAPGTLPPPPALPSDGTFVYMIFVKRRDGTPCEEEDLLPLEEEAINLFDVATQSYSNDVNVDVVANLTPQGIIAVRFYVQIHFTAPFSLAKAVGETLSALDPFETFEALNVHAVISGRRHHESEAGVGPVYETGLDDGQQMFGQATSDKFVPVYFSVSSLGGLIFGVALMFLLFRLRRRTITGDHSFTKDHHEFQNPVFPTAHHSVEKTNDNSETTSSVAARRAAELQAANNVSRLAFGTRNARTGNGSNKPLSKQNNPMAYNTQLQVVALSATDVDPSFP